MTVSDMRPVDPDLGEAQVGSRPSLDPLSIGVVALGGSVGTGLRYEVGALLPHGTGMSVATFGINVFGAFLLGLLLESLARVALDAAWARRLRLGLGTGGLGGFTTYSALCSDTVALSGTHPGQAVLYALGTVLLGGAASFTGIRMGRRLTQRRRGR